MTLEQLIAWAGAVWGLGTWIYLVVDARDGHED